MRKAYLPAEREPVIFGVHGAVAEHYGITPDIAEPHATALDYIVAAAAGWLTGTLGGALDARKVRFGPSGMTSDARGEIEKVEGVLVIKRIHVVYHLATPTEDREKVERAYKIHADYCPVFQSISKAIDITTELDWQSLWRLPPPRGSQRFEARPIKKKMKGDWIYLEIKYGAPVIPGTL